MDNFKKPIIIIGIFLSLFLILVSLGRQIKDALESGKRLERSAGEVADLQEENMRLRGRLIEVEGVTFIEEVARDKLNMLRPGETMVVIPEGAISRVLNEQKKEEPPKLPNWQGWLRLFFR